MATIIENRIALLRKNMKDKAVHTFILTRFDPHQSAYGRKNWNYVEHFSGFSGSAGMAVVTLDKCAFWTDGRYALQSQTELAGTEYLIFNTSVPSDISLEDFVMENTPKGSSFSFDERTLSMKSAADIIKRAELNGISYTAGMDIAAASIYEIQESPMSEAIIYDVEYAGVGRKDKLEKVMTEVKKKGATHYIISSTEDIAWTLNVRSKTDQTLSFEAFLILSEGKYVLFVQPDIIAPIKDALESDGVLIRDYNSIYDYVRESVDKEAKVLIAPARTCYALYDVIKNLNVVHTDIDITTNFKALKNKVELDKYKEVTTLDGVSMVKFIKWMKETGKDEGITEYQAYRKMQEIRSGFPQFIRSNDTGICAYKENGAVIHYTADKENSTLIKPSGMLLMDSVGYYMGGTTDITRTFMLGEITDEMKHNYTLVLKGLISLSCLVFMDGMSGHYIDIVARRPLWDEMLDYKHGTGHGISAALSVHEGPQRVATQPNNVPIKPGMLLSNEPGFYKNGEYGIRLENIILAKEHGVSEHGKFLSFETLTLAPFELEAIDFGLLSKKEVEWLNCYHEAVYEGLAPHLDDDEKAWLREETRKV